MPRSECDSAVDILGNLLVQDNYTELALIVGGTVLTIFALVAVSIVLGMHVRPRPPSYWTTRNWNPFNDDFYAEVDVTAEYLEPVQRLLDITTKRKFMGQGRDGDWATHKAFRVVRVARIESGKQWSVYSRMRNSVVRVSKSLQRLPLDLSEAVESTMHTVIDHINAERLNDPKVAPFLRSLHLDRERNECLLFHGSPTGGALNNETGEVLFETEEHSPAHAIKVGGFDERLGTLKGMFGAGAYFADMASKADQYAGQYHPKGSDNGSIGEQSVMFLARVVLGCPYVTKASLEQLRRPPCLEGHFDLNLSWNDEVEIGKPWREKGVPFCICDHPRYDSVVGDFIVDGRRRNYREYVVYKQQSYPEFYVLYERIA